MWIPKIKHYIAIILFLEHGETNNNLQAFFSIIFIAVSFVRD